MDRRAVVGPSHFNALIPVQTPLEFLNDSSSLLEFLNKQILGRWRDILILYFKCEMCVGFFSMHRRLHMFLRLSAVFRERTVTNTCMKHLFGL